MSATKSRAESRADCCQSSWSLAVGFLSSNSAIAFRKARAAASSLANCSQCSANFEKVSLAALLVACAANLGNWLRVPCTLQDCAASWPAPSQEILIKVQEEVPHVVGDSGDYNAIRRGPSRRYLIWVHRLGEVQREHARC
jgi:hypothetical protein